MTNDDVSLVPAALSIVAMRDNGYRNTAYALAELIDNSIQAGATRVDLLCREREMFVSQRTRRNISEIAVLDNGSGMDKEVLRRALQFGNGNYLDDRSGIGRFGMGLPSSSISQCRRLDVWSWQAESKNALWTYIDLDDVVAGRQSTVPLPKKKRIPDVWRKSSGNFQDTGTLVVWSNLDRSLWKTANAIINNSEFHIGRMYRRFILEETASIRLCAFLEDFAQKPELDRWVAVNDPLYLSIPSSTPSPYDQDAMFRHDGDKWEVEHDIEFRGDVHRVVTRFTVAKDEVRSQPQAGSTAHGKHAKRNIGVSLMRSNRELELEPSLVHTSEARERWWGVEVEFPPSLDEIFGVTNNKQSARNFSETASAMEEMLADGQTFHDLQTELRETDDPRGPLLDLVYLINQRLGVLRGLIRLQQHGAQAKQQVASNTAEAKGTTMTRVRQEQGKTGLSDEDEALPAEERARELQVELIEAGMAQGDAEELAARTIKQHLKYTFVPAELEGKNFFTVGSVGGEILIKVNVRHPAYKNLLEILEDDPGEDVGADELRARLGSTEYGLKLMLMAWARLEDETHTEQARDEIQEIRRAWGSMAYDFLRS